MNSYAHTRRRGQQVRNCLLVLRELQTRCTAADIIQRTGIGRRTVYRYLREIEAVFEVERWHEGCRLYSYKIKKWRPKCKKNE
jgi:DeoR/GlpR family transcriptional regulator of sugar metabolism